MAAGIVALMLILGLYIAYGVWLTNGIKPREFETTLRPEQLREIFHERVVRAGWKLVDDGNPLVAQSSLATGIRQQIGLHTVAADGHTRVVVGPHRWVTKGLVPKKAHTLRIRINSFVQAVQAKDPAISVRLGELRG